jgi:hypothetical protein
MKRTRAALSLTAATIVAAFSLGSPAQAEVSTYVKHGTYGWPDQCLGVGHQGKINNSWSAYYCETVIPTNWTAPGLYHLWVR